MFYSIKFYLVLVSDRIFGQNNAKVTDSRTHLEKFQMGELNATILI